MKIGGIFNIIGVGLKVACVAGAHIGPTRFLRLGSSTKKKRLGQVVEIYECEACGRHFERKYNGTIRSE